MKALVKSQPTRASGWSATRRSRRWASTTSLTSASGERHLRHRRPHLQLGRVEPEDHPGADDRRPRVRRRGGAGRRRGGGLQARRPGQRRGAPHLRLLPQLPRRPAPPVPPHRGRRRQPARLLRRVPQPPGGQRLPDPRRRSPTTSPPSSTPTATPTHTALSFDLVGEDVLITGAGPIGIMAVAIARHVGARHVVITDVNDYRLELAAKDGRHPGRERGAARSSPT